MKSQSKKFLSLLLGFSLAGSLCACGNGTASNPSVADDAGSEASNNESTEADSSSGIITANYSFSADTSDLDESSEISDTLYGLFLEDINYAVDGGLYAELIKNRSFEYGTAAANGNMHGWMHDDEEFLSFSVVDGSADGSCLNENNPSYAVLTNNGLSSASEYLGISNVGYLDGLAVTAGENYNASLFIKGDGTCTSVRISLENKDGTVYAEQILSGITDSWQKLETVLTPTETVNKDLILKVSIPAGSVCVDMISLMPEDTYQGLPIRKDLGEYMESLNPSFLRFPGGCVIEGKDEESMYNWKDSIGNALTYEINGVETTGDVSARPQGKDIWSGSSNNPYYTTYGIGFYEYFELCEALDALPVPVLNAGMTCQVQSPKYIVYPLSSDEFKQCVQDALDLVEFCRGDASTYWGSVRIAMGHEEPFTLKYIAIGNEQWQTEYHAHYEKFVEAFENAAKEEPELYGDIELIVANGTASGSTEGWSYIEDYPDSVTTLVDEHYYESPDWFMANTKRYDTYDRDAQADVFLGEYAAQSNTLKAALAEAAYMTGLERNADVVKMACYAPLFGNSTFNQWTPDMMFFSNDSICGTIDYQVQKIFANNVGTMILPSTLEMNNSTSVETLSGSVGLGSWMTSVAYDNLKITSNTDGAVLYEADFENDTTLKDDNWNIHEGDWSIKEGRLVQTNTGDPYDTNTGDAVYVGDASWSNYTLMVDAEILNGGEGFLIPVCVQNTANNIFWNIGGWGNTVSCLQIVENNAKSGQINGTVKNLVLKKNQVYQLKVIVEGNNIKCYIDDALYVDYTKEAVEPLYETTSIDENGDIIVKFVNVSENEIEIDTTISDINFSDYETEAVLTLLAGNDLGLQNSFEEPDKVAPTESTISVGESFSYTAPKYSVSIIRIKKK